MLLGILQIILQWAAGLLTALLLVRTVMRFLRISFVSPLGQFILATTNWAVTPLQRFIPGIGKLDLSSLLPAWAIQVLLAAVLAWLGSPLGLNPALIGIAALLGGTLGLIKVAIMMLTWVVIMTAILSFVNPHSPYYGSLNAFTRPFLRPFQRILPPIGGFDLSPLLLLLVLQIIQYCLDYVRI
jgi:YggT family protein